MSYLVQASRLTKIFLPEFQQRCIDNPETIFLAEPFTVTIPRSLGAVILQHNKPVHSSTLIPKSETRKSEVDETRDLLPWLLEFEETDIYGIVKLDVPDMTTEIVDLDLLSEDPAVQKKNVEKQLAMQKTMVKSMSKAIAEAQVRADERVKRTLRITHQNLMKQWETNVTNGGGKQLPSNTEALGAFILAEEIKRAGAGKQRMVEHLSTIMTTASAL